MMTIIRNADPEDFEEIWPIFQSVIEKGETYVYAPSTTYQQAFDIWMKRPLRTFVAEIDKTIVATYYIKPNYTGLGAHICSCGYMVHKAFRNQGIATQMCQHSLVTAKQLGFDAMQFNFVVSTNKASISLWKKMGFCIVGTIPNAYQHQHLGKVDIYIMYRGLEGILTPK